MNKEKTRKEVEEWYSKFKTEMSDKEFEYDGTKYDLLTVDAAGHEGDCGFQVRDTFLSLKGENKYTQIAHGNGDGYELLVVDEWLAEAANEFEHLNSDSWELLKKYEMELKEL